MGDYNPHRPRILGNEWVPIKQANYLSEMAVERGYTFAIDNTVIPASGSFNVAVTPPNNTVSAAEFMGVYPSGRETLTGPVQQVIIPVSAVSATGGGFLNVVPGALHNASDLSFIAFPAAGSLGMSFDMAPYAAALAGKRILDVSLLYAIDGPPDWLANMSVNLALAFDAVAQTISLAQGLEGPIVDFTRDHIGQVSLGDLNPFWNLFGVAPPSLLTSGAIYPWRSQELAMLAANATPATSRLIFVLFASALSSITSGGTVDYISLQITYCEEQRVKFGGKLVDANYPTSYNLGTNLFPLRSPDFSVSGSMAPGEYVVTLKHDYMGSPTSSRPDGIPTLHAIRQLYELPSHRGITVRETLLPGAVFTSQTVDELPQIALHHSGAVVTGSHAYGRQIGAPVYGSIIASQDIHEDDTQPSASFPNVRFYARRFGDTTVPLTLTPVTQGSGAVSISVADFDALPEIVDGWREVNLRFASPPVFPTVFINPNYEWSATGELVGNQWQILGADGPSVTGTQSYGPATYAAPDGATDLLEWKSPLQSAQTADPLTDATILLAVDPPTVTGFTLTPSTQAVTGIGLACGTPPRCIPTGISYTALTWSAISVPVTGFGQYEIERFDSLDNEWQQIMSASSIAVTGFNDYEARVGVESLYRIRACDVLDFCGPWTTGSATIPAPGITGSGGGAGVLIFTSNSDQAGAYNLAYRMQWETGGAQEDFIFPESRSVVLQDMYNKDFPTAFRPTERGGEQFSRVLLVQGAAISPESLADFRSLRDMAWADLPYVAVRDELGNRWYATVLVPGGNVRRNRTIYMAQVDVIETTDTAAPVDPS